EHRSDVVFRDRFWDAAASRISVTGKSADRLRHSRTLLVSFPGHDRGNGAAKRAAFHAIVTVTITHHQRTKVGVTEPKRPENVRVLCDLLDRVTRVIDHDLLRGNENAHGGFESFHVELAVRGLELEEIQGRKIAGGVIEKQIFAAWVGRILPAGAFAGVPFMDRGVELHPGIAADVCALGNFSEQRPRLFLFAWLS